MLTQRFPYPPDRGDRIRSYHLLQFLSNHFDVMLGCTTHEAIAPENTAHLRELASEVAVSPIGQWTKYRRAAQSVAAGASITEGYFHSPALTKSIRASHAKQPFDAILVYCSSMFQYRRRAGLSHIPAVVDLVDVDSQKWKQLATDSAGLKRRVYQLETSRTCRLEKHIASSAASVALTSPQEAQLFATTVGGSQIAHGISNGVDTQYFRVPEHRRAPHEAPLGTPRDATIQLVFTGVMDYQPNVEGMLWFCKHIWPLIIEQIPTHLKIVGRRPTPAIRELGKIAGIDVIGEVPDVRPYLDTADISISPLLLARGIQNKVLEAMASGLPTVVTPQSAEGIDAESGVQLQIARDASEFANAIVTLAKSPESRQVMGAAARERVEQQYSWPAKLAKFRELINDAMASRSHQTLNPS
jgi:polysaccharide biosynthesis protein PslH